LAGTYTAAQFAEELNLQVNGDVDGIEFITDEGDDYIGVQTTWAFGPDAELEFPISSRCHLWWTCGRR